MNGKTGIVDVGGGMRGVPGVMANFMEALQEENVEVLQTVDSHTTISALIKTEDLAKAVTVCIGNLDFLFNFCKGGK